ncbi:MAG: sulfatase, partial [Bryobacteraceae bacterium]
MSGISRRELLLGGLAQVPGTTRPPNFIIILADDQGYGDIGVNGSPHIRTPHIDRMAAEGVRFTDFYAQPLCGPSRAALLTGCYPVRNSLMFNHLPRARTGIHANEMTLAQCLKQRDYATAIIGKWHLGDAAPFLPTRRGFDSYFGLPYSNDMWPFHPKIKASADENPRLTAARARAEMTGYDGRGQTYPADWFPDLPLMENERVVELNPDEGTLTSRYTERAVQFIRQNARNPFFLYLAHAMPHVPLFPGKAFAGRSLRGRYGDAVEEIDASTGRIISTLKELGVDGNTLVIYTSDNGPWLPYGIDAGSAGPLRGGKGSQWEGASRVPAVMWWPGRIPAGRVTSEVAATLDLYPTFARLAGAPLPKHAIDGRDLWPLLTERGARSPHEAFFYYAAPVLYRAEVGPPVNQRILQAIRAGRWKLHLEGAGAKLRGVALYDLLEDFGENHDALTRNPDIGQRL